MKDGVYKLAEKMALLERARRSVPARSPEEELILGVMADLRQLDGIDRLVSATEDAAVRFKARALRAETMLNQRQAA